MHTRQQTVGNAWEIRAEEIALSISKTEDGWRKTIAGPEGAVGLTIVCEREFRIHARSSSGEERIYTEEDCVPTGSESSGSLVELRYREKGGLFAAAVRYEIEHGKYVKKTVSILPLRGSLYVKELTLESFVSDRPGLRGGQGQPVFLDGLAFLGVEFPVSRNESYGGRFTFGHSPGIDVASGREWRSYPMAYGLNEGKGLEEAFLAYVRRHRARRRIEPLAVYCDWGLHDELSDRIELTAEMTDGMLEHLRWMKETHGLSFDYYLIDAFWFEENEGYKSFKARTWPSGFGSIRRKMEDLGLKLGLWFDLSANFLRMESLSEARIEYGKHELCLGHPGYAGLLKEALLHHIRENGMKMIKFDFAAFVCSNPEHDHPPGDQSKEALIARFVEMLRDIREEEPEIVVLAYNGFTTDYDWIKDVDATKEGAAVSPWWAFHLDFIYCGDPRPSELPALRLRDSIHSYTDAMVRQFEHSLLPHETMDDHGVMIGDTGTIYRLGKEGWRNDWILSFSRGSRKTHFYGDLRMLNESDYIFLKSTWSLQKEATLGVYTTVSIAGDPIREEAYGYANGNDREGYVTLYNPHPVPTAVKLAGEFEKWAPSDTEPVALTKTYAGERWLAGDGREERLNPDEPVALRPFEVVMLKRTVAEASVRSRSEWLVEEIVPLTRMEGNAKIFTAGLKSSTPEDRWVVKYRDERMKPLRTVRGKPDGMTVEIAVAGRKRELAPLYEQDVWSGMSWMIYRTEEGWKDADEAVLSLSFAGARPIYVEVQKWIRKPGGNAS